MNVNLTPYVFLNIASLPENDTWNIAIRQLQIAMPRWEKCLNRIVKSPRLGNGDPISKKTGHFRTNVEPERIIFKYKRAQPKINVINGDRTRRLRKGDVTCMFQLAILRRLSGENGIINSFHGPGAGGCGYHRLSNASVKNAK